MNGTKRYVLRRTAQEWLEENGSTRWARTRTLALWVQANEFKDAEEGVKLFRAEEIDPYKSANRAGRRRPKLLRERELLDLHRLPI